MSWEGSDLEGAKPVIRELRRVEDGILALILAAMIALAAYQVIARNLFDTGLLWGDALVRVLVIWVAMIGAMVASRNDDHIRIDLLARFVPSRWQRLVKRFANAFTCAVMGLFAWHSYRFVRFEYEDGTLAFASVPAWACEAVLPVAAAVISLRYLLHTFDPP
ncbi:MAG: TRAP transporter small permease [Gammaproteobacteria bacterium]|nr:TRAP transporter small permease [Gammaproteobacteria bacterium]MYE50328.1 TRAP transporter small permease [Gammaproteobacteria bacterium]